MSSGGAGRCAPEPGGVAEAGGAATVLLPALLGGATLLLARRWASAHSSPLQPAPTPFSRRRRIVRDPPLPRSHHTLQHSARMMPSSAPRRSPQAPPRKSAGGAELAEEMPAGGRRVGRAQRYSTAPGVAAGAEPAAGAPAPEPPTPASPKHIPFPHVPQDGELLFEVMTFIFTTVAAGLQFLNLYRTVWWLPHSHTSQAMNFYLIDVHLVAFIVTLLSRRLLLSACTAMLRVIVAPKVTVHAIAAARMFILGMVLGALAWCTYFIVFKHTLLNIFFLLYPAAIYLGLFGLQSGPFLELANSDRPLLHCCYPTANGIRNEVDLFKSDFNLKLKKILFGSMLGAYYTSFIPCCFTQPYLYYDAYAATQQAALVLGALFTRYASHLLSSHYCDVLHRSARHLGGWTRVQPRDAPSPPVSWCARTLWPYGSRVVTPDGALYLSRSSINAAEPTSSTHRRFYAVFRNPSMLLCLLLCLQLSLILLQLCLLFSSSHWHHFLSLSVLLFSNYYTLFKLVRDYLVTWKVYRAEHMIQDKSPAT